MKDLGFSATINSDSFVRPITCEGQYKIVIIVRKVTINKIEKEWLYVFGNHKIITEIKI